MTAGQPLTGKVRGARTREDDLDSDLAPVPFAPIGRMAKYGLWIRTARMYSNPTGRRRASGYPALKGPERDVAGAARVSRGGRAGRGGRGQGYAPGQAAAPGTGAAPPPDARSGAARNARQRAAALACECSYFPRCRDSLSRVPHPQVPHIVISIVMAIAIVVLAIRVMATEKPLGIMT